MAGNTRECSETKVTFQVGLILTAMAAVIVMVFTALWTSNGRLTVLETDYTHVRSALTEIKQTVDDIRSDQVRRAKVEKK